MNFVLVSGPPIQGVNLGNPRALRGCDPSAKLIRLLVLALCADTEAPCPKYILRRPHLMGQCL
jgi:hypothetical protein